MGGIKAPGPDGLPPYFFQKNSEVVGPTVIEFVKEAFEHGHLSREMNATLVNLILKQDHLETMSQLKSIAMCILVINTITKIIANRLKNLMHVLVGK